MNFLIVTLRRLAKEKFYALLCVFSLALGLASAILISLYLLSELTFDRYHQNHDRIHRISTRFSDLEIAATGYETGPTLVRDNSQFLDYVRFREAFESSFSYGDNSNEWEDIYLADASVFDIFTVTAVRGDISTAFQEPYSIAISESFAEFYFSEQDPIGELLSTEKLELRVTLVFEDPPENVTQRYQALVPFELVEFYEPDYLDDFGGRFLFQSITTFLYVAEDFDPQSMAAASDYLFDTYMSTDFPIAMSDSGQFELELQRLSDIRFGKELMFDETSGNVLNLYIFAATALALLVISCINYVNLATARASTRVKEVAMKKILGATSKNLLSQFLLESVLFISLAFAVAVLLAFTAMELGYVESFTGKSELSELLLTPGRLLLFVSFGMLIGLLSGIYPAITLSRQSMLAVFNSQPKNWRLGLPLRQLLVLLQMIVSIVIISCVFIMLRQSDFLLESPMGFSKDNQLVVRLRTADAIRSREALMTELTRHNEIVSVVEMGNVLGRGLSIGVRQIENNQGEMESLTVNNFRVGEDFLESLEIELLQGTMFTNAQSEIEAFPVLVNETFVRQMEWEQPIGRLIGSNEVIGVVADFHYLPLHEPIAPVYVAPFNDLYLDRMTPNEQERASIDLVVNVSGNELADTRAFIQQTVRRFSNQSIIEARALSDVWADMYDDESQIISLVGIFGAVSIVISLLGLAGLAAYNSQQRAREIAIRKVLGASVTDVLALLSAGMVKIIAVAILPAAAGAYFSSNVWLESFAYRAEFSIVPYLSAILLVALFSISVLILQTYRTAQANPVAKLKYE